MKITSETLPERQVRLQIEVDEDRHNEALEQAYKRLAPRVQIRGFRPGKAPRTLIEKQIGRHRLLDEAMDIIVPAAYKEALEEQDLDPVASPSVEVVSHEPLVFTATVPLQPVVDLGDYQSLRLEKEVTPVKDEQLEEAITDLRRRYGTIEPVDREAQKGDIVRGSIRAETEGDVLFQQDEIEFRLTDEQLASLPGLADAIVGLKKGDEVEKTAEAPADFADARLAGKTATYKISIGDVKEEKLAALDDSFAKEVGEGFESLEALRTRVREDMQKAEDEAALRRLETAAVDALVDKATLEYPAVLLSHEIDHILEDQANLDPRDPRAVDLYLARMNKSEEEVRETVREEAIQRLKRSLVLSHFAEAENISVEDADIEEELTNMASSAGEQAEMLRRIFDTENGRDTLRRTLLTRKTLSRLVEITSGGEASATPASEAPEAAEAAPKRRRSGPRSAAVQAETEAATE